MSLHPSKRLIGLASCIGLLTGTLYAAPARWVGTVLQDLTHGRVLLVNTSGTFWRGKGDLVLSGGPDSASRLGLPGGIEWTLTPAWRSVALKLDLWAPCCTPEPLHAELGWNGAGPTLTLQDHRSEWPAQWLAGLGTPWNLLRLSGQIQLQTQHLKFSSDHQGGGLQGRLQLDAPQLSSGLSTLRPLGDYRLHIQGQKQGMRIDLKTLAGDLELSGNGQWSSSGLQFRGVAEARPERLNVLSNLLNILGKRDGQRTHIRFG